MIWLWVAITVGLVGAVALVGGVLPERWLDRYRAPLLGFATGTLLASGLGDLLPEALAARGLDAVPWAIGAVLLAGVLERMSARRERHRTQPVAPLALLVSDALHNIGDGMAIAAAFLVSTHLGVITSAAVLIHELPEEVADYALLRVAGLRKSVALTALAGVQLTAYIGAVGALLAASFLARANGIVLAIACGLFIYIAVFDLTPDLLRRREPSALVAALAGAAIVLVMS